MAEGRRGVDMERKFSFYEFFAGAGMARAGLGNEWECRFANDVAAVKVAAYTAKWGAEHLDARDINELSIDDLPGRADLAWASFPCQDLSVAGAGLGIGLASGGKAVTRSGALWPFLSLMNELKAERRKPGILVLENVAGLLTSNSGRDFRSICEELHALGYVFGALVVDAKHFLPQSRPRVFNLYRPFVGKEVKRVKADHCSYGGGEHHGIPSSGRRVFRDSSNGSSAKNYQADLGEQVWDDHPYLGCARR